jgi:hypothetical protein
MVSQGLLLHVYPYICYLLFALFEMLHCIVLYIVVALQAKPQYH